MSKKGIERIKSALIVVLFFATILLLYLVLGGSSNVKLTDLIKLRGNNAGAPEIADALLPEYVAYSAGDGAFSLAFGDTSQTVSRLTSKKVLVSDGITRFKSMSKEGSMISSEITDELYLNALTAYESVHFVYPFSIPFSEFCSAFGIRQTGTMSNIENISAFGFSAGAADSILLIDGENNKFYRLILDGALPSEEDYSLPCKDAVFSSEKYYFANDVLGIGGLNLIAIGQPEALPVASYHAEFGVESEDKRREIAEKVFGDTFDFVRRIEDGFGNFTYMYGYGAKTLTLTADGRLDYRTENSAASSSGWFSDLETALECIAQVGGWEPADGSHFELSYASSFAEDGKTIRQFGFTQYLGSTKLVRASGENAIFITIDNGSVSSYSRAVLQIGQKAQSTEALPMDAVNAMAAGSGTQENFNHAAENYKEIRKSYLVTEGELLPIWKLVLKDGSAYYYDLYTGEELINEALPMSNTN